MLVFGDANGTSEPTVGSLCSCEAQLPPPTPSTENKGINYSEIMPFEPPATCENTVLVPCYN